MEESKQNHLGLLKLSFQICDDSSLGERLAILNSYLNISEEPLGEFVPSSVIEAHYSSKEGMKQPVEYRSKRDAVQMKNYKLHAAYENITPFGLIGKFLSGVVNSLKTKTVNTLVFLTTLLLCLPPAPPCPTCQQETPFCNKDTIGVKERLLVEPECFNSC